MIQYQGQLIKNISKIAYLQNKQDVLTVSAVTTKPQTDKKVDDKSIAAGTGTSYKVDHLKLMVIQLLLKIN